MLRAPLHIGAPSIRCELFCTKSGLQSYAAQFGFIALLWCAHCALCAAQFAAVLRAACLLQCALQTCCISCTHSCSAVHCRWINEDEVDDVADFARWLPEEHDEYDEGADSGDGDDDGVYRALPMFDPHASHQRDYMKQFSERVYLSTEFHEKEKVKAMGARWDPECPRDNNPGGLRGKWCGTRPSRVTPASDTCSAKFCRGVMVTHSRDYGHKPLVSHSHRFRTCMPSKLHCFRHLGLVRSQTVKFATQHSNMTAGVQVRR